MCDNILHLPSFSLKTDMQSLWPGRLDTYFRNQKPFFSTFQSIYAPHVDMKFIILNHTQINKFWDENIEN